MNTFLADILNSPILISQNGINQFAPIFINALKGNETKLSKEEIEANAKLNAPVLLGLNSSGKTVATTYDERSSGEKYTLVMPIIGGVTKYNQFCGPAGTTTRHQVLKSALNDDSIESIVFKIDSPGGQASYLDVFADEIANAKKPTIAYVEGLAASAGYWIASQCDEVYLSSELDSVGSIGAYATYASLNKYFEKEGIDIKEVYATQSTQKNKFYYDLFNEESDDTLVKKRLDNLVSAFHKAVTNKRNITNADALAGAMFDGKEAIENKLADGIKSFEEVLQRAKELSTKNKNSNTMNTKDKNYARIGAVIGLEEETPIVLTDGHASLSEENLDSIEAAIEENAAASEELATANDTIADRDTTISDLEAQIATLTAENEELVKYKPQETTAGKKSDSFNAGQDNFEDQLLKGTKKSLGLK